MKSQAWKKRRTHAEWGESLLQAEFIGKSSR
jgi:hypothetical protein